MMKKKLEASEFSNGIFLLQPSRPILCTTVNEDGSDHIAPFSWCAPCSMDPLMFTIALRCIPEKQRSLINIERTGEFVINLPDARYANELVLTSYWQNFGENKFDRSCFTKLPSLAISPVCVNECATHLECVVVDSISPGDHTIFVAKVVAARYDDELFNDHWILDLDKFTPLFHLNHYVYEEISQVHIFCEATKLKLVDVSFLSSEQTKERCAAGKARNS